MVSNSQFYTACRKGRYGVFKKRTYLLICLFCLISGIGMAQPTRIGTDITFGQVVHRQCTSLSADGSIMAVSSAGYDGPAGIDTGYVRVYQNTNGSWTQQGSDITGSEAHVNIGASIKLSADGSILAIGATRGSENGLQNINAGFVEVYKYHSGSNSWVLLGSRINTTLIESFGYALDLSADGSVLAVGGPTHTSQETSLRGVLRIYHWDGNAWLQRGNDILGTAAYQFLGQSVSLNAKGTRVAVGGVFPGQGGLPVSTLGYVRAYEWDGSGWNQLGSDFIGGYDNALSHGEKLGYAISLNAEGNRLAIGAPQAVGTNYRGMIRVYSFNGNSWSLLGSPIQGSSSGNLFGTDLDLDASGNMLATGARYLFGNNPYRPTFARVCKYNGSVWTDVGSIIDIEQTPQGLVGNDAYITTRPVSLSSDGSILAVGNAYSGYTRVFAPEASKVWLGASGSDWTDGSNWTGGSAPSASDDVLIPKVDNRPIAASAVEVNSMILNPGASFIAQSTFTGSLTYNRYLGTDNWYLVGTPVSGESVDDIIATNALATGTGSNIGWASYNNTVGGWSYQTSASTGPLGTGKGYAVKLKSPNILPFTGTFTASDVTIALTEYGSSPGGSAFNLVGNPYPSYIAGNINANATANILKFNGVDNNYLAEATIWLWNQATVSYEAFNQASSTLHIAPGQGFFVRSAIGGTSAFSITEAMQSHQAGDTFQRSSTNTNPEIELTLSDQNSQKKTHIYYIEGTTTGFDNGYDSTVFGAGDSFSIYTRLVGDNQSQNIAIQSLPPNTYENTVVPIGVNAASGAQIHISAATANLPEDITVYLEDADNNTFTPLNQTSAFSTTLTADSSGIGRFSLHTSPQALGQNNPVLNGISIYAVEDQLLIVGLDRGDVHLRLYGMLGQRVLDTRFRATGSDAIALPRLGTGLYLVELLAETGRFHKKLILK